MCLRCSRFDSLQNRSNGPLRVGRCRFHVLGYVEFMFMLLRWSRLDSWFNFVCPFMIDASNGNAVPNREQNENLPSKRRCMYALSLSSPQPFPL